MAEVNAITNPNDIIDVSLLNYFEGKIAEKYQTQNLSAAISGLSAATVEGALAELLGKIQALPSAIVPKGTKSFEQLDPTTDLVAGCVGWMWNISDGFTTTSDFVEGSGKVIPAGANIYVVNNGTAQLPSYKYDIFAGMYDLSVFKTIDSLKSKGAANKGVYFDADGNAQAMTYELNKSVPADAVFTDTTYESLSPADGGTAVSLVTTGEKYAWNHIADGKADKLGAAFSATSTYAVGAKVIQGGKIYECTTAVETAGEWDTVKSNFKEITDEILILGGDGAYKPSGKKTSDFATATQGGKADSAVQDVKVGLNGGDSASVVDSNKVAELTFATGTNNGTVKVNGTEVAVKGLQNAAYRKVASTADIDQIFASSSSDSSSSE